MNNTSVHKYWKILFYPPNTDTGTFYKDSTDIDNDAQYTKLNTDILVFSVFSSIIILCSKPFFDTVDTSCRMMKNSLAEKIGKHRCTQRSHICFKVDVTLEFSFSNWSVWVFCRDWLNITNQNVLCKQSTQPCHFSVGPKSTSQTTACVNCETQESENHKFVTTCLYGISCAGILFLI